MGLFEQFSTAYKKTPPMVSQKDIAKKLNMTQQAVSAALRSDGRNGTVKVAPETRRLVLETARQLGYRSNRYASILKGGRSQLIAVLHGTITNDWIDKLRTVNRTVIASDYIPWTIEIKPEEKERVPRILDYILSAKVEGVIMAGAWFGWNPEWFWDQNVPVTSLHGQKVKDVPFFAPDKVDAFVEILYHLKARGCRYPIICRAIKASQYSQPYTLPPGYLERDYRQASDLRFGVESEAMMAFERFCGESGFVPPKPFHVLIPEDYVFGEIRNEFEVGRVLAREALPHKPDALVFTNDSMAVGGLYECHKAGLKVPRDLCITGFNGEESARYSLVPITTMTQPVEEMASAAVEKLIRMIEAKTLKEDFEQRLRCHFEPRLSTMYGHCP